MFSGFLGWLGNDYSSIYVFIYLMISGVGECRVKYLKLIVVIFKRDIFLIVFCIFCC